MYAQDVEISNMTCNSLCMGRNQFQRFTTSYEVWVPGDHNVGVVFSFSWMCELTDKFFYLYKRTTTCVLKRKHMCTSLSMSQRKSR